MNLTRTLMASAIALAGMGLLSAAQAQGVGQHPAVYAPRALPAVDPSTFIVRHPAGLAWRSGHANHEQPGGRPQSSPAAAEYRPLSGATPGDDELERRQRRASRNAGASAGHRSLTGSLTGSDGAVMAVG